MTDIDVEGERARFEAWAIEIGCTPEYRKRDNRGRYAAQWLDDAWDGWLAAKRDAAPGEFICTKCGLRTDAESSGDANF